MAQRAVHIGTSGWHYDHWQGPFYPPDLEPDRWLEFYTRRFVSVEVNNTFYQLPTKATVTRWRQVVPPDFLFSVKASRYLTHMKKLNDAAEPLRRLLERVSPLTQTLGPVLFQLPGRWSFDADRLRSFMALLPSSGRFAFEFRDHSWLNDECFHILAEADAALCIYDFAGRQSPKVLTCDWAYIRLHGPAAAYEGCYSLQELAGWAALVSQWTRKGKEVFCYFDNDQAGYAPQNAAILGGILGVEPLPADQPE